MNQENKIQIGLNFDELCLIESALKYFFKMTQVPELILMAYENADLPNLYHQIEIGKILTED